MHLKRVVLFLTMVLMLTVLHGCGRRNPTVARIDRRATITLQELRDYIYVENRFPKESEPKLFEALDYLNKLIDRKIILMSSYQSKLDRDSALVYEIDSRKKSWMLRELFNLMIIQHVVHEPAIRNYYSRMDRDVVVRTIFFTLSPQATPNEEKQTKAKAEAVLKKLAAGESFSELARRYSEDHTTSSNGGLIGTLSWNRPDDPIRQAAFSMKEGQVSGLVRNNLGIHILYVEEIQKKERQPLESVRQEIINVLSNANAEQIRERQGEVEKQVTERAAIRWRESELDSLARIFRMKRVFNRDGFLFCLDSLSRVEPSKVLVTYNKGQMNIGDFKQMAEERLPLHASMDFSNKEVLKGLMERWLVTDQLLDLARRKRLDRNPIVVESARKMLEQNMIRQLFQKEIYGVIRPEPDSIRAFYEREKSVRYSEPERVTIQEILVDSENLANRLYGWAISGTEFGSLAEQYTVRPTYRIKKGVFPEMQRGKGGLLAERGLAMQPGEISKPIPMGSGQFSIIKVLAKKAMAVKPFEAVQSAVANDYNESVRQNRLSAFLTRKKAEFGGVKVYNRVLEKQFDGK